MDSDSCGSDAESEDEHVVSLYEHDSMFKSKEELEHFSQGCDNVTQSESDSEEENVDYASWQGTRKVYSLCACVACAAICAARRRCWASQLSTLLLAALFMESQGKI